MCQRVYVPDLVHQPDFVEKWLSWQGIDKRPRTTIQRAWPNATQEQREQLMTGICDNTCWDAITRAETCDED